MRLTTKVMPGKPKVSGYLHYAPLGTALPVDAAASLNAGFVELGFVADDGVKPSAGFSEASESDWKGDKILTVEEEYDSNFEFTLVSELEQAVNEFLYGAVNVAVTAATASSGEKMSVKETGYTIPECSMVIDLAHGSKLLRRVYPQVKPIVTGIREYTRSKALGHTVKCTAHKDAAGNYSYKYTDDGVFA